MTTTKRKRVSKKNKSSWRKNANIKDVEEFLHEQAEEERLGLVSQKSDEDLFTFDEAPNNVSECSLKQKRKLNALKKPKGSARFSETQDLDETNKQKISLKKLNRALRAIKNRKGSLLRLKGKKIKRGVAAFVKDIWGEDPENDKSSEFQGEWISKELALHHLDGTGKELVKVHQSAHHKTTRAKAFQPPHPGTSYNPSYEDYQDLLENVVEKETEIIKQEKHLNRVTTGMFSSVPVEECDRFKSCEDPTESDENECEMDQSNANNSHLKVNKANKKKTKRERAKQKKVKELLKEQNLKRERKKQITDLHRLKSILDDVSIEKEETDEIIKRRRIRKEEKKFEPKRLSKMKFKEPDIDVTLPDELPENLRNMKCDSKLIVDKFRDFQKRNILPVNADVGTRKRRKIKRFVRKSHKE